MNKQKRKLKSKEKKNFPFDLYFLVISTIVVLPLVYSKEVADPTLSPRVFALGIIIAIVYVFLLFKKTHEKPDFKFLNKSIFSIYLIYLAWSVIISFFAVVPSEAMQDLSKTFLAIALFVYFTHIFITYKNTIPFLIKFVVLSSIFATALGLYQYFDSVPGKSGRALYESLYGITGLMAHKNQYAISLFLMLPFSLYGIIITKKYWRLMSIYSSVMILLSIFLVQTRSVWVATFVFIVIISVFVVILFFRKVKSNRSLYKKGIIIVGVLTISIGVSSIIIIQRTGTLELIENKVTSIFNSESDDNQGRLTVWESTVRLSKDNLIMGVGPGNWKVEILKYYPYNTRNTFQNWRRPHNDFLWILSERGIVGLILFLLIFILLTFYVSVLLRKESDVKQLLLVVMIYSGIIGYLFLSFFSFPIERINHQVYLAIMMALIVSMYYLNSKNRIYLPSKITKYVFLVFLLLIGPIIYYSYALVKSEESVHKLMYYKSKGDWNKVIYFSDKAFSKFIRIDSYNNPIGLHKGTAYINLKNYKQAHNALKTALSYFPNNIYVLNNLVITSVETNDVEHAISYANQALDIYPRFEECLINKVTLYMKVGDIDKAYIALLSCYNRKDKSFKAYKLMDDLKIRVNSSK